MTLTRITSTLGAMALGGVLVASTYGAQAAGPPASPDRTAHRQAARVSLTDHFQAPMAHGYGSNGMRMGLHCEDHDPS
jgi:hypothetical protein